MPELAAFYGVGFVVCLALTMVYVFLRNWRRHSRAASTLQENLQKAGYFWSDHRDSLVPYQKDANEAEAKKSQVAIGYTGLILSLLSWAGVVFLLIIMLSERFFARSRREQRIFASDLTKRNDFTVDSVRTEIAQLDILNDSPSEASSGGLG